MSLPVEIVPGGVDPDVYFSLTETEYEKRRWSFVAIGKPEARKNYEGLLAAYRRAFQKNDDVVLRIVATGNDAGRRDLERMVATALAEGGSPIELLPPIPDTEGVANLLRQSDVFVLPTRGEGWGLPILEAMACGCCVITTNWSAPVDFVTPETGLLLDYRLVDARCPYFGNLFAGRQWADPNIDQLVSYLRWTYEHRDEARAMGARAAEDARTRWTWRNAALKARELLLDSNGAAE